MNQLFLLTIVPMILIPHINADWGCSIEVGQSTTNEAEGRMFFAPQRPILWRNGQVDYVFDYFSEITKAEEFAVETAMQIIMNAVPCIRFVKKRGWNVQNALKVRKTCICHWTCNANPDYVQGSASLGFEPSGHSYLNIQTCLDQHIKKGHFWNGVGLLVHELLHTLGVPHTQCRSDSHNYIDVHWDNIVHDMKPNYYTNKTIFDTYQVEYDCMSIMHYRDNTFQIKGAGPTMTAKDPYSCDLKSKNIELKPSDITLLKRMYNCE